MLPHHHCIIAIQDQTRHTNQTTLNFQSKLKFHKQVSCRIKFILVLIASHTARWAKGWSEWFCESILFCFCQFSTVFQLYTDGLLTFPIFLDSVPILILYSASYCLLYGMNDLQLIFCSSFLLMVITIKLFLLHLYG